MKSGLILALVTSGAALGLGVLSPFTGCSSDAGTADGGDASFQGDTYDEGPNYCDYDAFLKGGGNGSECSPIAPNAPCFLMCEAGGCACITGPKGTGIWQCHIDTSCLPKCAPADPDCGLDGAGFADTGPLEETSFDAPSDAQPDATVDAASDAKADAAVDAGAPDAPPG